MDSTHLLLHIVDLLLWIVMAVSVAYVVFFALASLLPERHPTTNSGEAPAALPHFLLLIPCYAEDAVIRQTVAAALAQDYPTESLRIVVISDHMQASTNEWLAAQPVTLLRPAFDHSSKARALQYAVASQTADASFCPTHVVILDADNIVQPTFMRSLATVCRYDYTAIQCHRTAKNANSGVAVLDGVSEEINNTLFRLAHNRVGLSSALIGSGMCFTWQWFCQHVPQLSTAGEDRELEVLLLRQRHHIHYAPHLFVQDEKVSSGDNFQRQRLRWMSAQVQCLLAMLPHTPRALFTLNIDYLDKTLQQALIPRSILLVTTAAMAVAATLLAIVCNSLPTTFWLKWWCLLLLLCVSLIIAIPRQLRSRAVFAQALHVPQLAWRMLSNLMRIDRTNRNFIHTTHEHR